MDVSAYQDEVQLDSIRFVASTENGCTPNGHDNACPGRLLNLHSLSASVYLL